MTKRKYFKGWIDGWENSKNVQTRCTCWELYNLEIFQESYLMFLNSSFCSAAERLPKGSPREGFLDE